MQDFFYFFRGYYSQIRHIGYSRLFSLPFALKWAYRASFKDILPKMDFGLDVEPYGEWSERMACGRCGATVHEDEAESCWLCHGPLCPFCWDKYGCCNHAKRPKYPKLEAAMQRIINGFNQSGFDVDKVTRCEPLFKEETEDDRE